LEVAQSGQIAAGPPRPTTDDILAAARGVPPAAGRHGQLAQSARHAILALLSATAAARCRDRLNSKTGGRRGGGAGSSSSSLLLWLSTAPLLRRGRSKIVSRPRTPLSGILQGPLPRFSPRSRPSRRTATACATSTDPRPPSSDPLAALIGLQPGSLPCPRSRPPSTRFSSSLPRPVVAVAVARPSALLHLALLFLCSVSFLAIVRHVEPSPTSPREERRPSTATLRPFASLVPRPSATHHAALVPRL